MSLIAVSVGQRRAVICADSRGARLDKTKPSDQYQKLFQAGDYSAVGISGLAALSAVDFTQVRVERHCADPKLQDRPHELVSAIVLEVYRATVDAYVANRAEFRALASDSEISFAAVCVKRSRDGCLDLYEALIPLGSDGAPQFPTLEQKCEGLKTDKGPMTYALGALRELNYMSLAADLPDALLLRQADLLFESAGDEVSPPIDALAIGGDGCRWLRRKPDPAWLGAARQYLQAWEQLPEAQRVEIQRAALSGAA